ncbi:hypothetical protein PROFUN_01385 [Planoprotostelium fungivorum]|uniref:Uncharacterized protein n=1 Tax=Planoprotostelium fungivorum TaxID=1890364 RepID=A0A2P6NT29_9EUKA|nr:hypothetical protein PROFUN_01385 [Planoprotostelium fungivorum]
MSAASMVLPSSILRASATEEQVPREGGFYRVVEYLSQANSSLTVVAQQDQSPQTPITFTPRYSKKDLRWSTARAPGQQFGQFNQYNQFSPGFGQTFGFLPSIQNTLNPFVTNLLGSPGIIQTPLYNRAYGLPAGRTVTAIMHAEEDSKTRGSTTPSSSSSSAQPKVGYVNSQNSNQNNNKYKANDYDPYGNSNQYGQQYQYGQFYPQQGYGQQQQQQQQYDPYSQPTYVQYPQYPQFQQSSGLLGFPNQYIVQQGIQPVMSQTPGQLPLGTPLAAPQPVPVGIIYHAVNPSSSIMQTTTDRDKAVKVSQLYRTNAPLPSGKRALHTGEQFGEGALGFNVQPDSDEGYMDTTHFSPALNPPIGSDVGLMRMNEDKTWTSVPGVTDPETKRLVSDLGDNPSGDYVYTYSMPEKAQEATASS